MTITPESIAELRDLSDEAAQSPWKQTNDFHGRDWLVCSLGKDCGGNDWHVTTDGVHASELRGGPQEDAALICAARNALPELLNEIERLRAVIRETHEECVRTQKLYGTEHMVHLPGCKLHEIEP